VDAEQRDPDQLAEGERAGGEREAARSRHREGEERAGERGRQHPQREARRERRAVDRRGEARRVCAEREEALLAEGDAAAEEQEVGRERDEGFDPDPDEERERVVAHPLLARRAGPSATARNRSA
jgi:hypothetical protein